MVRKENPAHVRRTTKRIGAASVATDIDAWFAELDRFAGVPLMEDGRRQPEMPGSEDLFE